MACPRAADGWRSYGGSVPRRRVLLPLSKPLKQVAIRRAGASSRLACRISGGCVGF